MQNGQTAISGHESGISLNAMDEDDHLLLDAMVSSMLPSEPFCGTACTSL